MIAAGMLIAIALPAMLIRCIIGEIVAGWLEATRLDGR